VTEQTQQTPVVVGGRPTISLSGISKNYGAVAALTDVSIEVLPGEVHALLGENGAGKSTLIKIVAGVYRRDGGTMRVAGEEVAQVRIAHLGAMGAQLLQRSERFGSHGELPSWVASRASCSMRAQSAAATASLGATQDPPTQTTLGSAR